MSDFGHSIYVRVELTPLNHFFDLFLEDVDSNFIDNK